MRFFKRACIGPLFVAAAVSTPAFAQDEEVTGAGSPFSLSGGISVVSDYRFRGISLSDEEIALQPTLTLSHESGLYAGVWGSTMPDSPLSGKFELDLYGGYATEIASGTSVDVGMIYYTYPGNRDWAGSADYVEFIGKLSHDIGPLSATGTVAYAPDQKSQGDSWYYNLGLSSGIPNTPVTLRAGVGYSDGSLALTAPAGNYFDWSVGASYVIGPATLSARYVDTDIKKTGVKAIDTLYDPTVVFTLGVSF